MTKLKELLEKMRPAGSSMDAVELNRLIDGVLALVPAEADMRPETGNMRFEEDWTGVFIRGDDAFLFGTHLKTAIRRLNSDSDIHPITESVLRSLASLLEDCDEGRVQGRPETQIARLIKGKGTPDAQNNS